MHPVEDHELHWAEAPRSRLGIALVWSFIVVMSILIWIALAAALVRLAGW